MRVETTAYQSWRVLLRQRVARWAHLAPFARYVATVIEKCFFVPNVYYSPYILTV